jgi:hypothetical protein
VPIATMPEKRTTGTSRVPHDAELWPPELVSAMLYASGSYTGGTPQPSSTDWNRELVRILASSCN